MDGIRRKTPQRIIVQPDELKGLFEDILDEEDLQWDYLDGAISGVKDAVE